MALALCSLQASGAIYETLPKGVRIGGYRHVFTGEINSSYGANSSESTYALKENLNARNLETINDATKEYFNQLKEINPQAYEDFSFGEYSAEGKGEVSVNGFGLGWGLTNRLTAYFSVRVYSANVELSIERTKGNNHQNTVNQLNQNTNLTSEQRLIKDITAQLPDAKKELLQSIIVNYYNYKPIGNWEAQGLGDLEVGAIYRLTDASNWGAAIAGGLVLPTGRIDDPDILQDISFGDGQTDVFAELLIGRRLFYKSIDLDLGIRYTYQTASTKNLRVPESYEFPLSKYKSDFKEKLGNKLELTVGPTFEINKQYSIAAAYGYQNQGKAKYESEHTLANEILARNSDSESHNVKLSAQFNTVNLYKAHQFVMPLAVTLTGQKKIAGKNTPNNSQYEIDFKFFF
ncbi:hypothetical protein A9Q84_09935 [Halobacteriovorax marinus]|uniref:Uncharacterized protein n=1 Tax=Halobacteriovorax marinus TaxID=97084 RepID=A0A1Y5F787_9BACT|nr:hypothetical protein A9Q84_09935 [Halobacteriovorax marinus]